MKYQLRTIASLRLLRGGVAFALGFGLLSLSQDDAARHFLLSLQHHDAFVNDPVFSSILQEVAQISQRQLWAATVLAFLMGILRLVEGVGLWAQRAWASWMAAVTGAIYIPFEINELIHGFSWVMLLILIVNCLVLIYLIDVVYQRRLVVGDLRQ